MNPVIKPCPLCNAEATREYVGLKGYIEETSFSVFVCTNCQASFVDPMKESAGIYDYIYSQCALIPGYERYYRYALLAEQARHPLWWLMNAESAYWSVLKTIDANFSHKKADVSILEIGSGLGYLTHSLRKEGYQAYGVDISGQAVERAKQRYGNYFLHEDIFEMAQKNTAKYDCVVMMEVIEHVTNPPAFLKAATALVKTGGKLIVTTPNKDAVPEGVNSVWQSDFPPVHFWFYTERSMQIMLENIGKQYTFFDFSEYNRKFYAPQYDSSIEQIQNGLPRLLKNGKINPSYVADHTKSKWFGIRGRFFLSYLRRRLKKKHESVRSTTMCIVVE